MSLCTKSNYLCLLLHLQCFVTGLLHLSNDLFVDNYLTFLREQYCTVPCSEYCTGTFSRLIPLYVNMHFDIVVTLTYFTHTEQVIYNTRIKSEPTGKWLSTGN